MLPMSAHVSERMRPRTKIVRPNAAPGSTPPIGLAVGPEYLVLQAMTLATSLIKRDGKCLPLSWNEHHNHGSPLISIGTSLGDPAADLAALLLRLGALFARSERRSGVVIGKPLSARKAAATESATVASRRRRAPACGARALPGMADAVARRGLCWRAGRRLRQLVVSLLRSSDLVGQTGV
jgi:hypothetical protein